MSTQMLFVFENHAALLANELIHHVVAAFVPVKHGFAGKSGSTLFTQKTLLANFQIGVLMDVFCGIAHLN